MKTIFKLPMPMWRITIWTGALATLLTPWVLMQVGSPVEWTAFDFAVFGTLLLALCLGLELAMRLSMRWSYRIAATMTVVGGFFMVWANLAVGIIGNEEDPRNLLFYAILLLGLAGALFSRFDARGLMWTLRGMAVAQLLVFVIAATFDWALLPVFTIVYFAWWLVAGELFKKASRQLQIDQPTAAI